MGKRRKIPLTESRMRSALTNETRLLRVDSRDKQMRRLRDLVEAHVSDLGGMDVISIPNGYSSVGPPCSQC